MANHAEAGEIDEVVRLSTKFCDGDITHILEVQSEIRRVANVLGFPVGQGDGMSTMEIYDSLRRVYPTTDVSSGVVWEKTDRHRHGPDSGTATSIRGTVRNVRVKSAQDHVEEARTLIANGSARENTGTRQMFLGRGLEWAHNLPGYGDVIRSCVVGYIDLRMRPVVVVLPFQTGSEFSAAATAAWKGRPEFQGIQNVIKVGGACSGTLPLGHLYLMGTDSSQSVGVPMREYYTANTLTGKAVTYQDAREVQSIGTRFPSSEVLEWRDIYGDEYNNPHLYDPVTESRFTVGLAQVVSGPRFSNEALVGAGIGEWEAYALYKILSTKISGGQIGFSVLSFVSENMRDRVLSRPEWDQAMRRMRIALVSLLRRLN